MGKIIDFNSSRSNREKRLLLTGNGAGSNSNSYSPSYKALLNWEGDDFN
jgi:hypothetical protein